MLLSGVRNSTALSVVPENACRGTTRQHAAIVPQSAAKTDAREMTPVFRWKVMQLTVRNLPSRSNGPLSTRKQAEVATSDNFTIHNSPTTILRGSFVGRAARLPRARARGDRLPRPGPSVRLLDRIVVARRDLLPEVVVGGVRHRGRVAGRARARRGDAARGVQALDPRRPLEAVAVVTGRRRGRLQQERGDVPGTGGERRLPRGLDRAAVLEPPHRTAGCEVQEVRADRLPHAGRLVERGHGIREQPGAVGLARVLLD